MRQSFWPRLCKVMSDRGITQAKLLHLCEPFAAGAGVVITRSNISRYCHGLSIPRKNKMAVLAEALEVDKEWLSGNEPDTRLDIVHFDIDDVLQPLVSLSEAGIQRGKNGNATYAVTAGPGGHYIVTVTRAEPSDLIGVDLLMQAVNDVVVSRADTALLSRIARALVVGGVEREILTRIFPIRGDTSRQAKLPQAPQKIEECQPFDKVCGVTIQE